MLIWGVTCYLRLSFIMAQVGKLEEDSEVTLDYFPNCHKVGSLDMYIRLFI